MYLKRVFVNQASTVVLVQGLLRRLFWAKTCQSPGALRRNRSTMQTPQRVTTSWRWRPMMMGPSARGLYWWEWSARAVERRMARASKGRSWVPQMTLYHLCRHSVGECQEFLDRDSVVHTDRYRIITPSEIRDGKLSWLRPRERRDPLEEFEKRAKGRSVAEEEPPLEGDQLPGAPGESMEASDSSSGKGSEEVRRRLKRLKRELESAKKKLAEKQQKKDKAKSGHSRPSRGSRKRRKRRSRTGRSREAVHPLWRWSREIKRRKRNQSGGLTPDR